MSCAKTDAWLNPLQVWMKTKTKQSGGKFSGWREHANLAEVLLSLSFITNHSKEGKDGLVQHVADSQRDIKPTATTARMGMSLMSHNELTSQPSSQTSVVVLFCSCLVFIV